MQLLSVAVPLSLDKPFTYKSKHKIDSGTYILVPFGSRKIIGVVWPGEVDAVDYSKVKPIDKVFDLPRMSNSLIKLINWAANYTLSPLGSILKLALYSDAIATEHSEKFYKIANIEGIKITPQRQKLLDYLQGGEKSLYYIKSDIGTSNTVINGLVKIGALDESLRQVKQEFTEDKMHIDLPQLSHDQKNAAEKILDNKGKFLPILLDGVTGSGKTEVYFYVVAKILKSNPNAQILILLPEIILTSQLIRRFERRFGVEPICWHSGVSDRQRRQNFLKIMHNKARIVIGARSALFLPYQNLKLIIVDEEHDSSYKQEEGVIYNARDMSVLYSKILDIPVILASATPSVETYCNAQKGKYHHISLPSRFGHAVMPEVKIIDMRKEKLPASNWLSKELISEIGKNLADNKQSLLFLNRRGYAPLTLCRNCGFRVRCRDCSSWLVEHKTYSKLICHHCGFNSLIPKACPECAEEGKLVSCGPGVERIEEEAKKHFANANIVLMTSDDLQSIGQVNTQLEKIEKGDVDIIIGTQLVAKGHHFPKLTLVGIVDADLGLVGGDLKAAETSYQLLHQVAGRAGREKDLGRVFIQSYAPQNEVIKAIANNNRKDFFKFEYQSRQSAIMPPYSRLVCVVISGKCENVVQSFATQLALRFKELNDITTLGPAPAPIYLLRGKYRFRVLIKAALEVKIQNHVRKIMSTVKIPSSIKVKLDVDPYNFM